MTPEAQEPDRSPGEHLLRGVFAAAPTPVGADGRALGADDDFVPLFRHLSKDCHGTVVMGTTGEGPSLGLASRLSILSAATAARDMLAAEQDGRSPFLLLAGTGCPALEDTVRLTRAAFDNGLDGVLLLPPYYFRTATVAGLRDYFRRLIDAAVPPGGQVLLYHIPGVSGVPVPLELLEGLAEDYPDEVAGIKDSGGDLEHTLRTIRELPRLAVFTGNDRHLTAARAAGGAGAITALANLTGHLTRRAWEATVAPEGLAEAHADPTLEPQAQLTAARRVFEEFPSVPAVKAMLAEFHGLPEWPPLLPLQPLVRSDERRLAAALRPFMSDLGPER